MREWIITHWEEIAVVLIFSALFVVVLSTVGCCSARCTKVIQEPVEVLVPVPVSSPDLPIPELPDCGTAPAEWRDAALWLKDCIDTLLLKIEEYNHILEAHNQANETPSQ